MVISQTPYRVSFAGGGTDLPAFFEQQFGAVLSVALNKHMYVTISPRFDPSTRVAYSKTEVAEEVSDVQHTIAREALRMLGLGPHIEITTIGDVPAGTGLGSSSTVAVGLLNALYAYKGQVCSRSKLAKLSCEIEVDRLRKPIGYQDQYAAAFGGINYMRFNPDHSVEVEPVPCRHEVAEELERRILLFYTAQQRSADEILKKQTEGTADRMEVLLAMRDLADSMRHVLSGEGDLDEFARLLHQGWELKRSLGFGISNPLVDDWYGKALAAGAQGGKLLGAGGGGFLLIMAPPERHEAIRHALDRPRELEFGLDPLGSRIIFISEH